MNIRTTALAALAALALGCSPSKPVLELYTWSDYFDPEILQRFESENDCTVNVTTFDSNEAMYAKLKAGATGYDIITPSSYIIPLLTEEGLLEPLNRELIQNAVKSFDHGYDNMVNDPDMKYSVPYVVSYAGIMFNRNKVNLDGASWDVFSDRRYNGKVSLLDDIREVVGIGLMYNGHSVNSESKDEIDKAVGTIMSWRSNVRKFDAESYKTEVASGSIHFGHAYSSDSFQVIVGDGETGARKDLGFCYPKEGFTVACDEFVIMKNSGKKELSHRFIDFMYGTEQSRKTMEYNVSPVPNSKAISELEPELRKLIILDNETAKRGQVIRQFKNPSTQELYNSAWDRIRSIEK